VSRLAEIATWRAVPYAGTPATEYGRGMPAATAVDSVADDPGDIVATVARHLRLMSHGEHQLRGVCLCCGYRP
jgi:hypothetical protein